MTREDVALARSFGRRLRALREETGLSQEALAHKAGLDRTYVSGIERGVRNPSLKNIGKLARTLGVHVSALFESDAARR